MRDVIYTDIRYYAYLSGIKFARSHVSLCISILDVCNKLYAETSFRFRINPYYSVYTESKRRWHLPFVEFCSMFEGVVYHSFASMFQRIGDFFYDVNKCLSANTIVWVFHQKTKILLSFRLVDVYTHYQKIVERVKGEIVKFCTCGADFRDKLCCCDKLCTAYMLQIYKGKMKC